MSEQRIVVNGVEYGSVDEMPEDVRALYERALRAAAEARTAGDAVEVTSSDGAGSTPGHVTVHTVKTTTRFVVDGREYGSVDDLPPAARAALRDALGATSPNRLTYPAGRRQEPEEEEEDYAPAGGRRLRFSASVSPLRLALWIAVILFLIYWMFLRRG